MPIIDTPEATELKLMMGDWESLCTTLEMGWISPGAYCAELAQRYFLGEMLEKALRMQPENNLWQALSERLHLADERFERETVPVSYCVVDDWQKRLAEKGEEVWSNWPVGMTNVEKHSYLFRIEG
ncbi:hypothetical protein [Variovorax sp. PCZ-1]|uniref:hypothetical protein n=1 Tax=Variovorax sp. PCZ-1 TaxID=2835533 RepID=UPI001BCAF7C0|nr:hypothetical protein [Variovorax sp. PCZ-1]MBS7809009.1 hypothetical protein [Variovorax sp. PCZ-1]